MRMKKLLATGVACALCAVLLTIPALAHGHGHGRHGGRGSSGQITVCPFDDCTTGGRHTHDGVTYCGYGHENGYCNGSCYALCSVEGCTVTGRHYHNGVTYCGNHHDAGFCDGGCAYHVSRGSHRGGCHC